MLYERELPQRQLVRVPDVVGLPLRKALLLVQKAGLSVGAVLYKESYEEKDMVLEQRPQRGQMVYASEDVTLWVSRESYIKWLPAIYQRSDTTGRNVVRDVLWLVQHMFGSIDNILETIHTYFDSYETPSAFLPWLASWSAMLLEPDWPENKKRRLIKKAMELYRLRGTVRGLKLFISLFTGMEPDLVENEWPFKGFCIGVSSTVGIDTVILPPVDKCHSFVVLMPHEFKDTSPEEIIRLHEIVDRERPSHTTYMLKFAEPKIPVEEREFYRIGITSGINVGQEVVTPLPINFDTGEPELPKEPEMPPPQPDPSVYELFATKRRLLPPIVNAPKADGAPIEGREVTSNKYGFEDAARVFRLDDIMRELLQREGGTEAKPAGEGEVVEEIIPRVEATAEVVGSLRPGASPRTIMVDLDEVYEGPADEEAPAGEPKPAHVVRPPPLKLVEAKPAAPPVTPVDERKGLNTMEQAIVADLADAADSLATPVERRDAGDAEDAGAAKVETRAEIEGGRRGGRAPKVEVDVEIKEKESELAEPEASPAHATLIDSQIPELKDPRESKDAKDAKDPSDPKNQK